VSNAVAAGTSLVTSAAVDMANFEGCKFYVPIGTVVSGAATSVKLQGSDDNSTYADIEGSAVTVADDDDNKVVVIDIFRPRTRYLKALVVRATENATVDGIIAVRYGARVYPTTDDASTVITRELHQSPAAGTA